MTKLEALKELAAMVEAGEATKYSFFNKYDTTWSVISPHGGVASYAYNGSLDAAKALHEAVLPGWSGAVCLHGHAMIHNGFSVTADADDPARAWLLAILKALIAQEESR